MQMLINLIKLIVSIILIAPLSVYAYMPQIIAYGFPPISVGCTSYVDHANLEGRWALENNLNDSSGNGYTLTGSGSPAYDSVSPIVGSYSLDLEKSSSQYAYIIDASLGTSFPLASAGTVKTFTALVKFRCESIADADTIIAKYNSSVNARSFEIRFNSSNTLDVFNGYNSGASFETDSHASALSVDVNYGLAYTYNDSTRAYRLRIYNLDTHAVVGTDLTGTWANNISIDTAAFTIGNKDGGSEYFDGVIDEVSMIAAELSTAEIYEYFEVSCPDTSAPVHSSSSVASNGTTWTFVTDKDLYIGTGGSGGLTATMDQAGVISFSSLAVSGHNITAEGTPTVEVTDTLVSGVSYTQPGDGFESKEAGTDLATFSNHATFTNNSTQGGGIELYYVTQSGSGVRDGTISAPWSVSDFNDSANWSSSQSSTQIDPGDTVYFSGTITSTIIPAGSGLSGNPITLDGYAAGSCTPKSSYTSAAAHITAAPPAISLADGRNYIVIRDFTFSPLTGFETDDNTAPGSRIYSPAGSEITGLEIRNCAFGKGTVSGYGTVGLSGRVNDFVIDNNYWFSDRWADPPTNTIAYGQNLVIAGANRGRITNNKTYGGYTSAFLQLKQGSFQKVVAANNEFNYSKEEGYSMDSAPDGRSVSPIYEYDAVASSTSTTITLNNTGGEWTSAGNTYGGSDYYMVFVDGPLMGRHALITSQSNAVFTLDTEGGLDFLDADVGDHIVIGYTYRKNYSGYNSASNTGNDGPFLLYGMGFENLTENNYITKPYNSHLHIRGLWDVPLNTTSFTGGANICGFAPTGANLLKNNTLLTTGGSYYVQLGMFNFDKDSCSYLPDEPFYARFNTAINNIVDDNGGTGNTVYMGYQYGYASGNTDASSNPISPTLYNSTSNIADIVYWPYISGSITISSNGTTVTVGMSENTVMTGYTTGDAWLEYADETKVNLSYSSGSGSTSIVLTATSPILTGETVYFWFNGADDSIQDSSGNDMPVYGFKPVTNNSTQ